MIFLEELGREALDRRSAAAVKEVVSSREKANTGQLALTNRASLYLV